MVSNSSSVPRRMSRNSGMSPIPSGRSRHTSSVTPGRMVGLIMPTTPRQLENAIACSRRLFAVVSACAFRGHVAFLDVGRNGRAIAQLRIAVAAAARALQEEAFARVHIHARGSSRLELSRTAEPHHEAGTTPVLPACYSLGRKARLVE